MTGFPNKILMQRKAEKRFSSKLKLSNKGCLEWQGWVHSSGYGYIQVNKKQIFVHRYAYEIWYGKIPEGLCVLHKCDNRICVAPLHLFLGTRDLNNKDRAMKNRSFKRTGELNNNSKLTEKQVLEIREKLKNTPHGLGAKLAKTYNVSTDTIHKIKHRIYWRDL